MKTHKCQLTLKFEKFKNSKNFEIRKIFEIRNLEIRKILRSEILKFEILKSEILKSEIYFEIRNPLPRPPSPPFHPP